MGGDPGAPFEAPRKSGDQECGGWASFILKADGRQDGGLQECRELNSGTLDSRGGGGGLVPTSVAGESVEPYNLFLRRRYCISSLVVNTSYLAGMWC